MLLEELTLLDCEQGHRFYVPNDQLVDENDEEIDLRDTMSNLWRNDCHICK